MRGGARHHFGGAQNPFRNPPVGSVLEAAYRLVYPDDTHLDDPLKPVVDYLRTDVMQNLYEKLQATPGFTEAQRRDIANVYAGVDTERFRDAMNAPDPLRRPGRPGNDLFICMIAVVQVKRCEREMPGSSRDAIFRAAAKALGGSITKRQVRTAWCKVGRAAAACSNAYAYDALAEIFRIAETALNTTYSLPKSA